MSVVLRFANVMQDKLQGWIAGKVVFRADGGIDVLEDLEVRLAPLR